MALTHARLTQFLSETDYFGDLDLLVLSAISSRFEVRMISTGSELFTAGDVAEAWYIIVEGSISIWGDTPGGERCLLTHLRPGDSFGELSLLEDNTRSASAVAAEASTLLRLPSAAFRRLLDDGNPAAVHLLRALAIRMSRRMHEMSDTIQQLRDPGSPVSQTDDVL
ncbi:MAG: CRP/FNR family cyclic AMP-dependent transcriptional regulator [Myxococcota bacterium]|jgi:CRP/FNR family cyclic AMP-dependent transcriptional regulator